MVFSQAPKEMQEYIKDYYKKKFWYRYRKI